jgi:hypothetical protein
MRRALRDGWRYERADMFKCLALLALLLAVVAAGALAFAQFWAEADKHGRELATVAICGYFVGVMSARRRRP